MSNSMESDESLSDFGFAFNDVNFSDRILRIEIIPGSKPDPNHTLSDWARNRKRRRDDFIDLTAKSEEQILNCNMPDLEDGAAEENQDEAVAMIEEPSEPGNEDCMDYSAVEVKTINISSPILASKSPFFYKLFSSNKRGRDQGHITLQIQESEEGALMDLLIFMYTNTLSRTTPSALLDVLMAADKYEVASCMRYCSQLLRKLPMTCESALLYLDLPSTVSMVDTVLPLADAAKEFFAARFKDISKFQEEVFNLPLAGIEAVLVSDDLQVVSEDAVYDFVMKWARKHYPKSDVRRQILNKHLLQYVRFPCMSSRKLKKVLNCPDIDRELSSKFVLDALFFKSETPHRQRSIISEEPNPTSRQFVERAYKYRPVKVIEFGTPREQCVVYLDLKREECANLFPAGRVYSQVFYLGGQGFFLSGHCNMEQHNSYRCFGLFLGMQEKGSVGFTVEYEFSSRMKPEEEFVSKYKGNYTFSGGKAVGYRNLFSMPWCAFTSEASPYFINGTLHLRAELTVKK